MTGPRPTVVVVVAGTGTDVGKTWVAARLLEAWRRTGLSVAARKPAQSFAVGSGPTDAEVLGAASGESPLSVCPPTRSYPVAFAPPMAASALGLPPPTMAELVAELAWPDPAVDVGLVETAGGVRSPQADDGDVVALVSALVPDHVLLVADAGLGTINAVRLSLGALTEGLHHDTGTGWDHSRLPPAPVVVLNRFDPSSDLHRRNRAWLLHHDAIDAFAATEAPSAGLSALAARLAETRVETRRAVDERRAGGEERAADDQMDMA
jgi:dethiobiotin synthetase